MAKRKTIPQSVRFEVFKRDKFTCQYCGRKAPDVVLHVDHIKPVAKEGGNDLLNLLTACDACNGGKGARELGDDSVVAKQRKQLEALQERRAQIDMMIQWEAGLGDLWKYAVDQICGVWEQLVPGWCMNDDGRRRLTAAISEHGIELVAQELRAAAARCVRVVDGKATDESVANCSQVFFNRLKWLADRQRDPLGSELRYVRGILRKRFSIDSRSKLSNALELMREATDTGVDVARIRQYALDAYSYSAWVDAVRGAMAKTPEGTR